MSFNYQIINGTRINRIFKRGLKLIMTQEISENQRSNPQILKFLLVSLFLKLRNLF